MRAAAIVSISLAVAFLAGTPPDALGQASQPPKTVTFVENEVRGRTVTTDAEGLLQILFADGTTLTLGPSSSVTIDSFAFDPVKSTATLQATLAGGVFRFIGGRTSKTPDGVSFVTPFGVIAIEGAGADFDLGSEDRPAHFDMVYGGGSMALTKGPAALARVHKAGYSIVVEGTRASVRKTPPEWRALLRNLLSSDVRPRIEHAAVVVPTPFRSSQS